VEKLPIAQLKEELRLGETWWEARLKEWFERQSLGVFMQVNAFQWSSASAAAAEKERREQEAQGETTKLREAQFRADREREELEQKHLADLERIESDRTLDKRVREQQVQISELNFKAERLRAEETVTALIREGEKSAVAHELELVSLRRRIAEERTAALQEELAQQQLPEAKRRKLEHQAAIYRQQDEPLKDEARRLEELRGLFQFQHEHALVMKVLENGLHGKQVNDERPVAIEMAKISTRDVMGRKTNAVEINNSVAFQVMSKREGYVTLLNLGTSGRLHVLIPNQFVGTDAATVKANRLYSVPGEEFLPVEALRRAGFDGFVEAGPPGWEVLAVIVSNRPLTTTAILSSAEASGPFFTLHSNQVDEIITRLSELKPDEWSVGIVSFLAECRKDSDHRW
jgi:hypothetical protein